MRIVNYQTEWDEKEKDLRRFSLLYRQAKADFKVILR